MIEYLVHGNKWVFAAVFGGAGLVLLFVLTCWAMWRPREEEEQKSTQEITSVRSFFSWLVGIVPWAIILTLLGTLAYTIIHIAYAVIRTPNW